MGYNVQIYSSFGISDVHALLNRARQLHIQSPIEYLPDFSPNAFAAKDFLAAIDNYFNDPEPLKRLLTQNLYHTIASSVQEAVTHYHSMSGFQNALNNLKNSISENRSKFLPPEKHCAYFIKGLMIAKTLAPDTKVIYAQTFGNGPTIVDYAATIRGDAMWIAMGHSNDMNFIESEEIRYRFQRAGLIIADSENARSMFHEKLAPAIPYIPVVYRGIDTSLYKTVKDRNPDIPVQILALARLEKVKGFNYLIEAFSILPDHISCELHIYGDGSEREVLMKMICDLKQQNRIKMHKYMPQEKIIDIIKMADIHVLPAIYIQDKKASKTTDSVSRALLEFSASAVPSIVTNVGGLKEFVQHDKNGLIVPERDAQAIASAILDLYENPKKREQLGQAAQKRVQQEFDYRESQKCLEGLISSALERWPEKIPFVSPKGETGRESFGI